MDHLTNSEIKNVWILTPDLSDKRLLTTYASIHITHHWINPGTIELTTKASQENREWLILDNFIQDQNSKLVFVIEDVQYRPEKNELFVAGKTFDTLLNRYVTSGVTAVTRDVPALIGNRLMYRKPPKFHLTYGRVNASVPVDPVVVETGPALDSVLPIMEQFDIGRELYLRNGEFYYELTGGRDSTQTAYVPEFSSATGTAQNVVIEDDSSNWYNAVLLRVHVDNTTGVFDEYELDESVPDPKNPWYKRVYYGGEVQREDYETSSDFAARYQQYAKNLLAERRRSTRFQGEIDPDGYGNFGYLLGDLVRVQGGGVARIVGIDLTIDGDGKKLVLQIGDVPKTVLDDIRLKWGKI